MSEWIVYSKDGLTERCRLKRLEYNGSFMNERTISATFEYHSEVAFDVFDYIVYRNEKFELESIPSVKKISNHNYEYELRFVSLKYELERCEMRDIVPKDNGVTYPTPLTFSFTGDVRYLTERIQANLDSLYGEGVWSIVIPEGVKSEEKNITISQQNCWNALSLVNTTYNLTFSIKGRVITVGGEQSLVGHVFQYGKGKGLYEIERVSDTDTGIVTKVRAYGGTRNLDYSYPKRPEWTDSVLPVSFALSPLRLMLPSFKLDGKTDYVLADDSIISEYGIREASVVYDDIYPSITGMLNYDDEPIDEIKSVDEVDDSKDTFVVYLYDLGFDLESNLTTENAQISMKSGSLIGYTFNISEIEKLEDNSYKITLGRITNEEGDTGNFNIPNSQWSIAAGDKFVLLNILMPQEYIRNAEERLLERAKEYLNEYGRTNFSYNVGLHDKFLKENADIYEELIEGSKLRIYDQNLGISEDVTIQSITITENMGDNMLTQVKVTLNNKPSASTIERIQGQIKELSETSAGQFSTQSELLKQYRRKLDKPFFDRLFAAVDINGNEIPSTDLSTPIAYIKARYSVASIGGFTMYLNDNSYNLPTIYDGLPIDNNTIYWEDGILKAKGGGGSISEITRQMVIDALGFTPYSAENPNGYITSATLDGYLSLSGGTITSSEGAPLNINSIAGYTVIRLQINGINYSEFGADQYWGTFLGSAGKNQKLGIKPDGTPFYNEYSLIHSGNIGSQSVSYATNSWNAKHLVYKSTSPNVPLGMGEIAYSLVSKYDAGCLPADYNANGVLTLNTHQGFYHHQLGFSSNGNIYSRYIGGIELSDNIAWKQLAFTDSDITGNAATATNVAWSGVTGKPSTLSGYGITDNVAMQGKPNNFIHSSNEWTVVPSGYTGDIWLNYRTQDSSNGNILNYHFCDGKGGSLATISRGSFDGNAASSTKLQTARTIWGQSFDGTGDVKGNINLNSSLLCWFNDPTNYSINGATGGLVYTAFYGHKFCTRNCEVLTITDGGNVGIGTTSPAYKLDVIGTIYGDLKMKTPRKIWGQSFDGTGDVKGNINLNSSLLCWFNDPTNYSINGATGGLVYTAFYGHKFCTRNGEVLTIADGGNVGIGTTNPLDKLHVAGNLRLKNSDTYYGNYIYFGDDRYCYLGEIVDDQLTLYGRNGIQLNSKVNITSDTTIDGNLLVRGGITMYKTDGNVTPFLIDVQDWELIDSISVTQVYTAHVTTLLKEKVKEFGEDVTELSESLDSKILIIKNALQNITSNSSISAIGTALNTLYNSL